MTLTRRKHYLSLLRCACDERSTASVSAVTATAAVAATRFVALARDGVLLEWPSPTPEAIPCSGALADVHFTHRGSRLMFRTETIGRVWWTTPGRGDSDCWKLRLPLCLVPDQPSPEQPIRLPGPGPIMLRCTSIADAERHFTARLERLSTCGLTARADAVCQELCAPGTILWTQFQIPRERRPLEFVVQVKQARLQPAAGSRPLMEFRGEFCPTDDPALTAGQFERLLRRDPSTNRLSEALAGCAQEWELERC